MIIEGIEQFEDEMMEVAIGLVALAAELGYLVGFQLVFNCSLPFFLQFKPGFYFNFASDLLILLSEYPLEDYCSDLYAAESLLSV